MLPNWLKRLSGATGTLLDRFYDASERFMALMCAALVVPLATIADVMIALQGSSEGQRIVRSHLDLDRVAPAYLGGTAAVAAVVALYSAYSSSSLAAGLAAWLDRVMHPIAYVASALLLIFALLLWLRP